MKHVFKHTDGRIVVAHLGKATLEDIKILVSMEYAGCKDLPSDMEYRAAWCQCPNTKDIIEDLTKVKEIKKAKLAAEQKIARDAMKEQFLEADMDGDETAKQTIRDAIAANKAAEATAMSDIDALEDLQSVKDYQLGE